MGCDERVERANRRAPLLQECSQLAVSIASNLVEGNHRELSEQDAKIGFGAPRLSALGNAESELGQRDRAHPKLRRGNTLKVAADSFVSVDDGDADVRIEKDSHMGRRLSAPLVFQRRTG